MEVNNLAIVWHDGNEPVYSVHFQPGCDESERLVTGGGDNNVRVWRLKKNGDDVKVEYLSTLSRHTQAVNVVRFDPKGKILATAGDDGTVLIWTLSETIVKEFGQEEDDDLQETWTLRHSCRSSTSEIYDIAWSPDSKYIITGSTDNVSRIYDASSGQQVNQIAEHNHYVQGVAWDPLGQFIATQSADRSLHIYSLNSNPNDTIGVSPKVHHKISRAELPTRIETEPVEEEKEEVNSDHTSPATITSIPSRCGSPLSAIRVQNSNLLNFNAMKSSMLYHTENLESFFRRLSFSPDGNFLFTTAGIFKKNEKDELINTVYVYSRFGLNKPPIAHLPGYKKAALIVSFSPIFYELNNNEPSVFKLPYKMIYAVATQDSIFIYDTQHLQALGTISSVHYRILTDLSWNSDGNSLIVSSADGFCTLISFKENEFGNKLKVDYRSLLPNFENEITNMDSPKLKKRVNEIQPSSIKKVKIDSNIFKAFKKNDQVIDDNTGIVNKERPVVVDCGNDKEHAINVDEITETTAIKKKKRITPTTITKNDE